MAAKSQKSQSTVAARDQLDQQAAVADPNEGLESQATEQEKQQKAELAAGAKVPSGASEKYIKEGNVAAARSSSGFSGNGTQNGFVDQLSRRSAEDALEGHFVRIDLNNKDVQAAYSNTQGLDGHQGDYGVYLRVGDVDEKTGHPVTAVVRLRDETNAQVIVPYEALRPADAGSR
jgi:predicted RecA/RadA family phage recombinase